MKYKIKEFLNNNPNAVIEVDNGKCSISEEYLTNMLGYVLIKK